MPVLGLDTSNYTTSVARFDGETGQNQGRLLDVRQGELGLRQSDALFQHIKHLPEQLEALATSAGLDGLRAVGASTRPRAVEGSYMPCFLAGESQGRALALSLGIPFFPVSHQQGHLAAAAWSAGEMQLLDAPFLAWHLSGGTTELLLVEPEGENVCARRIGGTADISAGQLIDRTGVRLALSFPAGRALDALAGEEPGGEKPFPVKMRGLEFSLSGVENQVTDRIDRGMAGAEVARFVLDTVAKITAWTTTEARRQWPDLPVLFSGGVASNRRLRHQMAPLGAIFAQPMYSTDNALGVAILTHRALERGRL